MTITGIDAVTYGVANLTKATTFFADWGLERRSRGATKAVFATADGSEVVVRPRSAKALPKAIERKSTIRALTWGVTAKRDLTVIERELGNDREVEHDRDGTLWSTDDNGLALGFRVSRRKRLTSKPTGVNAPGAIQRVDQRATYYERAHPLTIGHVVMNVRDRERTKRFYMERLGFALSDVYQGRGVFLRARARAGHHNLFLLEAENGPTLNHVAFGVRDIHELFAGGQFMSNRGWPTAIGPGRHRISSAYFWYFKNPAGGLAEYFWDEDSLTERWQPGTWDPAPDTFAEWVLANGLPRARALPPTRARRDAK